MTDSQRRSVPEVGDRVQLVGGLPRSYGRPLGVVRGVGPANARVQLYYDGSEHHVAHSHLRVDSTLWAPWVIVSCGAAKLDRSALAADMYVGPFHHLVRRAAAALTGKSRILILSARYGLLRVSDVIEPYDLRLGQPGAVTAAEVCQQAAERGLRVLHPLVVLAGRDYTELARGVWRYLVAPLAGCRGIGEQRARLAEIARTGGLQAAATDPGIGTT